MSAPRHFLGLDSTDGETLRRLIARARALKAARGTPAGAGDALKGRMLAMIFEKPSTRTRVSFEVAMHQLGGQTLILTPGESQLGRGETTEDTARVLSRYVDGIMIRTSSHERLLALAASASVPVINGLTERTHPCQLLADIMTFEEHRGPIAGRTIAWLGDGNNVAATWVQAAARFGFALRLGCPAGHAPAPAALDWAITQGARVVLAASPEEAVRGAHLVVTDTWLSMADSTTKDLAPFEPYRVDERIMALADGQAIFMHCLPAKRGQEVCAAVIDGPRSVVWDEAENRVHAQKAILLWCLAPQALG